MGALGVLFLLVVLGQTTASDPALLSVLSVVGWGLWAVFVAELALRAYVARDQRTFWRRSWWQVLFLLLPFLRLLRALTILRAARVGGVLSAAVRGSRSAGRLLSGRLAWLSVVTGVVVLASSQVTYLLGLHDSYGEALHDAAMSTVTGAPLDAEGSTARLLEVGLAVYSVVVFATLAATLGAFFLDRGPGEGGPVEGGAAPPG
ncbi:hypothetical protein GCM10027194_20980 [Thalassiella azotivora]